VAKVVPIY